MRPTTLPFVLLFMLPALPALAGGPDIHDLIMLQRACGNDIRSLCPGLARGGGQLARCMMTHADDLSRGCADVLKAERAKFPATTIGTLPYDLD